MAWNPKRHFGCIRKLKFPTRVPAEIAARRMRNRYSQKNIWPYQCRFCGYYHVGHWGNGEKPYWVKRGYRHAKRVVDSIAMLADLCDCAT
jgi:hypothetical protein